ncbi:hypothetical protein GGR57DRAFT_53231 [Xylariaceae sp. FL1272]|nr:hypothetical protein GGR57DRAFT_53231 [Xylariaceae sp. FL1272]
MAKKAPVIRYLVELFWHGEAFYTGLRFKTPPKITTNAEGKKVHTRRFILRFPQSNTIARKICKSLGSKRKIAISHVLADLYLYAADNVEHCQHMEPVDFFGETKWSRPWADVLTNDQFWALTRRLLHARALYIATFSNPRLVPEPANELADSLDKLKEAFDKYYDLNDLSNIGPRPSQNDNEGVEDRLSRLRQLHNKYFGLTRANQIGDESNYIEETVIDNDTEVAYPYVYTDSYVAEIERNEKMPRDMEIPVGWFFGLGPRNPRYGHKGLAEQIDDAMDMQDAQEGEGKLMREMEAQSRAAEDDDGHTMNDAMDLDMDIDMGGLIF